MCGKKQASLVGGVFHAYSGSWEMAKEVLDLGFISPLAARLPLKTPRKIVEVVEKTLFQSLLIETDCPYLTPIPIGKKK